MQCSSNCIPLACTDKNDHTDNSRVITIRRTTTIITTTIITTTITSMVVTIRSLLLPDVSVKAQHKQVFIHEFGCGMHAVHT